MTAVSDFYARLRIVLRAFHKKRRHLLVRKLERL
jgi:hypothetical protein